MSLFRVYIAVSVDGYIADSDGGVAWLDPYFTPDIDFNAFTATIMGRRTFEQSLTFGEWRPASKRTIVLTHRPIDNPPSGVETFAGDVDELAEDLRHDMARIGKDVWLMGGGESIRPFAEAGLVDRWELFVIPLLLGSGVPLFPAGQPTGAALTPTRSETYDNGIVELWYEPSEEEAS